MFWELWVRNNLKWSCVIADNYVAGLDRTSSKREEPDQSVYRRKTVKHIAAIAVFIIVGTGVSGGVRTQEPTLGWPQWGGPARNFHVDAGSIARIWPESGPRQLWRRSLGEGYSAILVDGNVLVTMYRSNEREVVVALDAETGITKWEFAYAAPLTRNGYFDVWFNAAGPGPYSSPVIADGVVFSVGVNGHFHALDLVTGRLVWSHNLVDLFKLDNYNAFASSPLVYDRTVILPLGGSSRGVVAFEQDSGSVVWHSDEFPLAPGSPLLIRLDGKDQLVVVGQQMLAGLGPDDGRLLWTHPHENELGLNVSMPIWGDDDRLFISSAYDGGSRMVHLRQVDNQTITEEIWATNRMRLHFGNALRLGELLIGSSGDFGPAFLTAVNASSGEEVWRDRSFARAHLLHSNDVIIITDEDGEIAVASVSQQGLDVHARKVVLTENAWTPPTLVDGRLYLRDRRDIVALDLR